MNIELPEEAIEEIAARAAALVIEQLGTSENGASEYVTIVEAAEIMRAKRHRIDDLLSKGALTRVKDGARTLILRSELEAYLAGKPTGRRAR